MKRPLIIINLSAERRRYRARWISIARNMVAAGLPRHEIYRVVGAMRALC